MRKYNRRSQGLKPNVFSTRTARLEELAEKGTIRVDLYQPQPSLGGMVARTRNSKLTMDYRYRTQGNDDEGIPRVQSPAGDE
jgi:hypothetical protein